jgi:phosphoglycerate kinase
MRTIDDRDVAGARVFLRADLNVPLADGRVVDDTRIRAALPTIEELRGLGATIVLASHLGRPHGSDPALSLRPVAERLQQLTDASVMLAPAVVGEEVRDLTRGGTARSCCSRTCALSPGRPPMTGAGQGAGRARGRLCQ